MAVFSSFASMYRASIDTARKKMTVLSPSPGRLPSKTALIGVSIKSISRINLLYADCTSPFAFQSLDWQDS